MDLTLGSSMYIYEPLHHGMRPMVQMLPWFVPKAWSTDMLKQAEWGPPRMGSDYQQ